MNVLLGLWTNDKLLSEPASTKLGYYSNFRIRSAKLSYDGTENVAIYAFSWVNFQILGNMLL